MSRLKLISRSGVPEAISKAEVYRYLNEPGEAESICRDILAIEPDNQVAQRLLGLSITDQFNGSHADRYAEAESVFQGLNNRYERLYYTGLLHERRAKAQLRAGHPPHSLMVLFEEAMRCFEAAEEIRPEGNDDSILRWNRCARLLDAHFTHERTEEPESFDLSDTAPL